MRILLIIPVLFCFLSCSEKQPDFEIKKLADIKGKRTDLADSTGLELISFSGYDVSRKDVSPQIIARSEKDDKLYRIVVLPMFADYPVKKHMTFRLASKLNLEALKAISEAKIPLSADLNESMSEGIQKVQSDFRAANVSAYQQKDENKIHVFFNPRHREHEEQELPVVLGWVQ